MARILHLAMRVRDVTRSREFYERGLGLTFIGYRPSGTSMDLTDGAVNLTLLPYEGDERSPLEEGCEFVHIGLLVEDLEGTYDRVSHLGGLVVRDDVKERRPVGGEAPRQSFKVLDPDGNVLDVTARTDEWRRSPQ